MISYSWSKRFSAYAPPRTWGSWIYAGEHFGEVWFEIAYRAPADIPVKGRVRYLDHDSGKQEVKEFRDNVAVNTDDSYGLVSVGFQSLGSVGTTVEVETSLYGTPEQTDVPEH